MPGAFRRHSAASVRIGVTVLALSLQRGQVPAAPPPSPSRFTHPTNSHVTVTACHMPSRAAHTQSQHRGPAFLLPFQRTPLGSHPHRSYEPNTLDINSDEEELRWWLDILRQQIPTVVEKACASEGGGEAARRRAVAFGRCARRRAWVGS